jgi:hypothetical protein
VIAFAILPLRKGGHKMLWGDQRKKLYIDLTPDVKAFPKLAAP